MVIREILQKYIERDFWSIKVGERDKFLMEMDENEREKIKGIMEAHEYKFWGDPPRLVQLIEKLKMGDLMIRVKFWRGFTELERSTEEEE